MKHHCPRHNFIKRTLFAGLSLASLTFAWHAHALDRYTVDPEHSFSVYEYNHWGLSRQQGRFDGNTGFIELDLDNSSGSVSIDIPTALVHTGVALFDKAMRSGSFFDVEKYPHMQFRSTRLEFANDKLTKVEGTLSIKGITKPITLELIDFNCHFMPIYAKRACGANGSAKILRSDFELGRFVPFVGDEVTLYITVEAIRD